MYNDLIDYLQTNMGLGNFMNRFDQFEIYFIGTYIF